MTRRGITLIELSIAMLLLTLLVGFVLTLFSMGRQTSDISTSSYLVSGQTETGIRWLMRDLKESALACIQTQTSPAPGASMVSPRAYDPAKDDILLVNRFGAPKWDKHVYYGLQVQPGNRTGNLVRWERDLAVKNGLPTPAAIMPIPASGAKRRVLIHDLVGPNQNFPEAGPTVASDAFGGFRLQFVRRLGGEGGEEQLVNGNPHSGNPIDNTSLIEVELKLFLEKGRGDYYAVKFRVHPQY